MLVLFLVRNGSLAFFSASCDHHRRPLALSLVSFMCEFLDFFATINLQGVHPVSYFCDFEIRCFVLEVFNPFSPCPSNFQRVFWSLKGSSDFPTLSTLISVGFSACPSAPCLPGVSGMISYRGRGLFASSFRRFLLSFLLPSSKFPVA